MAVDLDNEVRRMGTLPTAPDPDREAFARLITRLKTAFAKDRDNTLIEESVEYEERFSDRIDAALERPFPPSILALLHRMRQHSETAQAQFKEKS
jgi:hypothetical protein